ncbi:hypothetical protein IIU_00364 [Bacillus cereus VD133]|uniref:Uncharacterized protein n=1 Tax=Bacillus cereus VD133 TaxID=1053233 RepID=A0A9W5V536_BACCE|nr:hypothetical protein [Bacillus cereus]EOO41625.1 hypothetical protein IIU_00364 [Bacillus cereus VD133]
MDAFWYGANGCEFIAWKGSHQIFVYPCDEYPNPPSEIIQFSERIETIDDFRMALDKGGKLKCSYVDADMFEKDLERFK